MLSPKTAADTMLTQFHCNPQFADRIAMIKETSTCSYLMVIDTPRLCHDVAFLPPQKNLAHPVTCQAVIPAVDAEEWISATLEAKIREEERLLALTESEDSANINPLRDITGGLEGTTKRGPIIGGIEVGAKSLVGSEGKVIEKTVVVSKEEMKRLNIPDSKNVEKLKGDLRKLAGKNGWRLDLVDTPKGREFRGIIEADDADEEKSTEKGGKNVNGVKEGKERKSSGKGMGAGKQEQAASEAVEEEEEEEEEEEGGEVVHEGSEEVYKDEL